MFKTISPIKVVGIVNYIIHERQDEDGLTSFILRVSGYYVKNDTMYPTYNNISWATVMIKTPFTIVPQTSTYEFYTEEPQTQKYKGVVQQVFKANSMGYHKFTNDKGTIKWLKRSNGVGEKKAKIIWNKYKEDIWDVIENKREEMYSLCDEYKEIKKEHIDGIIKLYDEEFGAAKVIQVLTPEFLNETQALKVYATFKEKTIQVLYENPYAFTRLKGIGFLTADKIALQIGFKPDSRERFKAAIIYALTIIDKKSDCYIFVDGADGMFNLLMDELNFKENIIKSIKHIYQYDNENEYMNTPQYKHYEKKYYNILLECLDEMEKVENSPISFRIIDEKKAYYATYVFNNENKLAELIKSFNQPIDIDHKRLNECLSEVEKEQKLFLTDEQKRAIINIFSNRLSVLTGAAGTGKTTTTKILFYLFQKYYDGEQTKRISLSAPTGKAARRMKDVIGSYSQTIHKLLESTYGYFKRNEKRRLEQDIFIVDEFSMVDLDLATCLFKALPDTAFIILIGDHNQLPSIGAGNVLHDVIKSGLVNVSYLTTILRQAKENKIIKYAHDVIYYNKYKKTNKSLSVPLTDWQLFDKHFGDIPNPVDIWFKKKENILLTEKPDVLYYDANRIPKDTPQKSDFLVKLFVEIIPRYYGYSYSDIQIISPKKEGDLGIFNINNKIQEAINPASPNKEEIRVSINNKNIIFRVGDKVIHTVNNNKIRLLPDMEESLVNNGEMGVILEIGEDEDNKFYCDIEYDTGIYRYNKKQMHELLLGYCITIHKSQGSESPVVITTFTKGDYMMLVNNLIYTAMTRAKKLLLIYGDKEALKMGIENTKVAKRKTYLKELLIK